MTDLSGDGPSAKAAKSFSEQIKWSAMEAMEA